MKRDSEGLTDYMKAVGSHPVLTREEEVELFRRLEEGDESARDEIVASNLRFVISIAQQFTGRGMPLEDLIQEGNVGLIEVVSKFDYRRGFRFSTYAAFWIRQSIQQALRKQANLIRLPIRKSRLLGCVNDVIRRFQAGKGRAPTAKELAAAIDVSEQTATDLLRMREPVLSLDQPSGDGASLTDVLKGADRDSIVDQLSNEERKSKVRSALEFLTDKERRVLRLRFGFDSGDSASLRSASRVVGMSQEGVRRVEKRALRKLRRPSILARMAGLL